jgi:putative thioredoxin
VTTALGADQPTLQERLARVRDLSNEGKQLAMVDVTDATFATDVVERSQTVPVVVDLWAPWCGPCRQLGPLLEQTIGATNGRVELAKVNVDENPQIAQMFKVQGIPAVFAIKDGRVVDSFVGAQGNEVVAAFVERLLPTEAEDHLAALVDAGDEASLRAALEIDPGHAGAIVALAEILVGDGRGEEALTLLARIPETDETRRVAAIARTGSPETTEITTKLDELLTKVKFDDEARQEYVDLLEILGAAHPQTADYRRRLSSALY